MNYIFSLITLNSKVHNNGTNIRICRKTQYLHIIDLFQFI